MVSFFPAPFVYTEMKGFKGWVKEDDDSRASIKKLPKGHQSLVRGYDIVFEPRNTLKGDDGHVGMVIDRPKKIIRVAAPWNYGREFAMIHEIAHLVYAAYMTDDLRRRWKKLAMSTKGRKKDENAEELFCHAYANYFVTRPVVIHDHPEWKKFIKEFVLLTGRKHG